MKDILVKYQGIILLLKVFALVPFSIKISDNFFKIENKKFYACLQLFYFTILVLLLGTGIFYHKLFDNRNLLIFDCVSYVGAIIAFMMIMTETMRNHDQHEELITVVYKIRQLLSNNFGSSRKTERCLFNYNAKFFISLLVILANYILLLILFRLRLRINFIYYLETVLVLFGLVVRIFQVEFYVHLLDECFKNINLHLNDFNCDNNNTVIELLVNLKCAFYEIWKAQKLINDLFGWGLVCVILMYFFSFVCDTYRIVLTFTGGVQTISRIESLLINVPNLISMGRLLYASYKINNSMMMTVNLLHKIEHQYSADCTIGNKFNEISYQFIQLPMKLATPFFPLDFSFLFRVISGTATFVIILVQFHATD